MTAAEIDAARAATEALRAEAAAIGAPFHIKANGRWCRLRAISGDRLTYAAPAKQQRARRATHQPVLIETTLSQVAAA